MLVWVYWFVFLWCLWVCCWFAFVIPSWVRLIELLLVFGVCLFGSDVFSVWIWFLIWD